MKKNICMNSGVCLLGLVMLTAGVGTAAAGETFFLVKVQDMKRSTEYQILSQAELKALEKELQLEAKFFQQAVTLAAKDWRSDELYKSISYPGTRLAPRKIFGQPERFPSQELAEKRLDFYHDAEARKLERERKKMQELEKNKDQKAIDAIKLKEKEQQEKDAQLDKAIDFVQVRLDELMGREPAEKPATNKPPAKAQAGKALDKAL